MNNSFVVYILRTSRNTLYIGQTKDLEKRLKHHRDKKGVGSKYMRAFESFELVYTESFETRNEAMKREYILKQLTKVQKEKLVEAQNNTQPDCFGSEYRNSQ